MNASYALESDENSEFSFKSLDYYQDLDDIKNAMTLGTKLCCYRYQYIGIVGIIGPRRLLLNGRKRNGRGNKPFCYRDKRAGEGVGES